MQTRSLGATGVTTSALGLGCAGIFRLADRAGRTALLQAAFAAGIRHFDTAPMYGLGRAEAELAPLLRAHRDEVTVTTKFGIEPSVVGRTVGRVQGPARALLARRPALQRKAGESGAGPSSGSVGRLLYAAAGYDAVTAARSLHRSLRALGTDHIDVFALHDPVGTVVRDVPELIVFLDDQVRAGTIRCWGVAGATPPPGSDAARVVSNATLVQQHDDVFCDVAHIPADKAVITFGSLARALPALLGFLTDDRSAATRWNERFGGEVDASTLAGLLLREAVRRNPRGVVLFSTTRPDRASAAVHALTEPEDPGEAPALDAMVVEAAQHLPHLGPA